jgi:hypothetical protein
MFRWPGSPNAGSVELNVLQSRIICSIWACLPVAQMSYFGKYTTGAASRISPS